LHDLPRLSRPPGCSMCASSVHPFIPSTRSTPLINSLRHVLHANCNFIALLFVAQHFFVFSKSTVLRKDEGRGSNSPSPRPRLFTVILLLFLSWRNIFSYALIVISVNACYERGWMACQKSKRSGAKSYPAHAPLGEKIM